jgi:hypothetical protein
LQRVEPADLVYPSHVYILLLNSFCAQVSKPVFQQVGDWSSWVLIWPLNDDNCINWCTYLLLHLNWFRNSMRFKFNINTL